MKPDLGPICPVFLLGAGIVWLLVRLRNAESRPERIGIAATACGVGGFIPALWAPVFKDPGDTAFLICLGIMTLLLAVAAVATAIWALRVRRANRQGSALYPVLGIACGVANLLCGSGILAMGSRVLVPTGGEPWTWRSEQYEFEVTIPSDRWTLRPNPNVQAYFTCPRPLIMAIVAEVRPAGTDTEFEAALAVGREAKGSAPASGPEERSGPNRHGHPHWIYIADKTGEKGPYVFGVSVTRVRGKAVVMMFEGQYRMASEAGRGQEGLAFRQAAREFLGSVK